MNGSQSLTFIVDEKGNISVDAEGFSGNECLEASQPFLDELGGGSDTEIEMKPQNVVQKVDLIDKISM
ncbi:MAG TPA: DUF2997 domain-containing protein [Trichocoleus sp.]